MAKSNILPSPPHIYISSIMWSECYHQIQDVSGRTAKSFRWTEILSPLVWCKVPKRLRGWSEKLSAPACSRASAESFLLIHLTSSTLNLNFYRLVGSAEPPNGNWAIHLWLIKILKNIFWGLLWILIADIPLSYLQKKKWWERSVMFFIGTPIKNYLFLQWCRK